MNISQLYNNYQKLSRNFFELGLCAFGLCKSPILILEFLQSCTWRGPPPSGRMSSRLTPLSHIDNWVTHTDKHDTCPAPIMFTSTKEKGIMKILGIICNTILILVAVMALVISAISGIFYLTGFSLLCLVALTYSLNGFLMMR